MMPTGWGGVQSGGPEFCDHRTFLYMTCDCQDFFRGVEYGMDEQAFTLRKNRIDTISLADSDDVDAIEHLYQQEMIAVGDVLLLNERFPGSLVFKRSEKAHRTYFVTRTFKPYKRKEGGKTSYHVVLVTTEAVEPTEFCCKHILAVGAMMNPELELDWMTNNAKIFLSNAVALS